ncbi:MAG: ribosome assembly factor SBDS [Candidatus Diapherotrites archaeon]
MVKLEDAVIARYTKEGKHFEIFVDPDLALKLKRNQSIRLDDLLVTDTIYTDAKKGEEAKEGDIQNVFHTLDIKEIAPKIVKEGEVHLTTEQRRLLREEKRKAIVDFISRNAFNPQTHSPHPPVRIENALAELKIQVDEWKDVSSQVNEILPKLRRLLPISMEKVQIAFKIPPTYASTALNLLHRYEVKKQEWQGDGSLIAIVEVPGGMKQELFEKINHLTHGEATTKLLESPSLH